MKKIFGGINLTWPKVIIMALVMGVYGAVMALLPIARNTSFSDLDVTFEVWIFFGIFIIMNSKSPLDSALKCLVFFVISQPLIYIIQDVYQHSNFQLFITYYRNWIPWTIACFPMGFIGYYMKKDKWWGIFILLPILLLLCGMLSTYVSETMFSFPRHLLTAIFCLVTLFVYPIAIFKDKVARIIGLVFSALMAIVVIVLCFVKPPIYSTDVLSDSEFKFNDTYKVYLKDSKYGDVKIKYEDAIEAWMVHADFRGAGETELVVEAPNGEKRIYTLKIKRDSYDIEKKK